MAERHSWREIKSKASPQTLERAAQKTEALNAAMELDSLRRARDLTQEELAERMEKNQGQISRTLRRADMHVSTLRQVIEAMGGEMVITARFPDAEVRIGQFDRDDAA
ncbi:MAG TPA: XRE family transcriptional regulator [Longimicrobiaceae bacterium]|nr:XRE family transcriptional regulator [Longimicrobiaceae bacterium]